MCPEHTSSEREGLDGKVRAVAADEPTAPPPVDPIEKPLGSFRKLLSAVADEHRAAFADGVLAALSEARP